jgi:hypothetical protein
MFCRRLLVAAFILFGQFSYADSCPTVNQIKHNEIKSWHVFDSDDHKLLSDNRLTKFKNEVEEFALAEWVARGHKQGAVHCFYRDKHGSTLEAYLGKNHFNLSQNKYWYQVSGAMHCAADSISCGFYQSNNSTQLAKNS